MLLHSLWTGCGPEAATAAQQALLERYVSTPFSLRHIPIRLPTLRLGTQQIATFEMNADAPGPVIVWAHGAGAGLGFGYKNYDHLANLGGMRRRVVAFDWLGQANSSRPTFPVAGFRLLPLSPTEYADAALKFFLVSFEAWREAMGIESMIFFAHSTGGYVAAHYAMAHPGRVVRLVLHGVAGLGSHPKAPSAQPNGPPVGPSAGEDVGSSGEQAEEASGTQAGEASGSQAGEASGSSRGSSRGSSPRKSLRKSATIGKIVRSPLWDSGILNFGMIQRLGRLAKEPGRKRFIDFQGYRAGITDEEELRLLYEYFYTALCGRPLSSDSWVNALLVFVDGEEHRGLYARKPLADEPASRLAMLPPTMVIYGERDWVQTPSALRAAETLPNFALRVEPRAHHHLYLDRPAVFHAFAEEALTLTLEGHERL